MLPFGLDEATLVRYALLAVAGGAIAYGIWQYLKPPKGPEPESVPSPLSVGR